MPIDIGVDFSVMVEMTTKLKVKSEKLRVGYINDCNLLV